MVSQVTSSPLDTNTNALLAPQEKYDAFFELVDRFLWDSEDDLEERQYYGQRYRRRGMVNFFDCPSFFCFYQNCFVFEGWMQMRRPRFLSAQNRRDEPSSMYRNFVDTCYSGLCWLGLSPLVDTVASLG